MKKLLTFLVALGLLFTLFGTASAIIVPTDYADGDIANGIANSRHNLGSTGIHFRADNSNSVAQNASGGGGTSEICIFCHTPHLANDWLEIPLWNKGAQFTGNYSTYGTTVGGTSADTVPNCSTLACLSCHDGVNTFDTIVNYPGKSGTVRTDMGWLFTEDGNTMSDYMTSGRLNLGTDLRNDHPVSITYTEDRASLRPVSTQITSISMHNDVLTQVSTTTSTSATTTSNLWAVGGFLDGSATISQLLRSGKVECVSCHDPHFKNQSWDEVAATWGGGDVVEGSDDMDGLFLRRIAGNSLSGVCRTCHNK